MAPPITQGATGSWQRSPAMKVWVFHLPKGRIGNEPLAPELRP